ncbi:MAG: dihydrolipoyl dehydrogenase [Chthonomonadaceae bacterium]|nr:dihydrolipoyl dehydrogenase [Chthonomonadaceae bacterium]
MSQPPERNDARLSASPATPQVSHPKDVVLEPPVRTLPDEILIEKTLERLLSPIEILIEQEREESRPPKEKPEMSASGEIENDIVVIGSGPGGYVAAIRAAQLGAKTVCIEKEASEWGGTCLNWGCIPTKTMIASVERLNHVKTADKMGVIINGEITFDFDKMMERKTKVVTTLRGGVSALLKSNHVRSVVGTAKLVDANTIEVSLADGTTETIRTKNIVLATGSVPMFPPVPGLARVPTDKRGESSNGVWTSDEAVYAKSCPQKMVIIGAGIVGMEFSFTFRNLGAEVNVIEFAPEIIPTIDREIAAELRKSLTRQGVKIHVDSKVTKVEHNGTTNIITFENAKGVQTLEADVVLVATGRRANHEGLNLEAAGVKVGKRGVEVDEYNRTNVSGIYAIGDITGKLMLAHVASHMGIVAVENAMGHSVKMDFRAVPGPIYTNPEVATVGLSEEEAREKGYDVMTGRFPFRPLGRAMALNEQEGMVKIISERKYGELLGVAIVGPFATELIHEAVMAIKLEATVDEMISMIHAHPTLSEAMGEAALDVKGDAIHKLKK